MYQKESWLKRMLFGGLIAVATAFALIVLINFVLNSLTWGSGSPDYTNIQLTFDRCAAYFGSAWLAVLVELLSVFILGMGIGLATLPFAQTWTSLLGLSFLHFIVTGLVAQAVGWSYLWFGMSPYDGPWMIGLLYAALYILIWGVRWIVWYTELRKLRKALGLRKETSHAAENRFTHH